MQYQRCQLCHVLCQPLTMDFSSLHRPFWRSHSAPEPPACPSRISEAVSDLKACVGSHAGEALEDDGPCLGNQCFTDLQTDVRQLPIVSMGKGFLTWLLKLQQFHAHPGGKYICRSRLVSLTGRDAYDSMTFWDL